MSSQSVEEGVTGHKGHSATRSHTNTHLPFPGFSSGEEQRDTGALQESPVKVWGQQVSPDSARTGHSG